MYFINISSDIRQLWIHRFILYISIVYYQDEDSDPLLSSFSQLKDVLNSIAGIVLGSVKNKWELSYISKTMKRNLLKFGMFIEQSYLHNQSKEWTTQRDIIQCDVILGDVMLWSPFAQWKTKT